MHESSTSPSETTEKNKLAWTATVDPNAKYPVCTDNQLAYPDLRGGASRKARHYRDHPFFCVETLKKNCRESVNFRGRGDSGAGLDRNLTPRVESAA